MLKRTMILLGLTITVGALLLVVGCGGHNTALPIGSDISSSVSRSENLPPSAPMVSLASTIWGNQLVLFRATDPEGNRLKYRVIFKNTTNGITVTYDQTIDSLGFNKSDYASGEWGSFEIPKNIPSGSYMVNAQAWDGQAWGPTNNPPRYFFK